MGLRISGKSVDIGESFRSHVEARVSDALEKYFDGGFTGHVTVEREGSGFKTDCAIHLDTGIVLQAHGHGQDAHQSFDRAAERIEKQAAAEGASSRPPRRNHAGDGICNRRAGREQRGPD